MRYAIYLIVIVGRLTLKFGKLWLPTYLLLNTKRTLLLIFLNRLDKVLGAFGIILLNNRSDPT